MSRFRFLVILLALPAFALPAPAGLFSKRTPPDPVVRVPDLLAVVKSEPNERKVAAAVDELRQYDAKAFPEVIPVLVNVLRNDPRTGVRLQALHTLSSFRPVSQPVGQALDDAAANDKSLRVRLQARTTLVSYHWSGYHAAKAPEPPAPTVHGPTTKEPPLAVAPPAATPTPAPIAAPVAGMARPMPTGPTQSPPVTTTPPPTAAPEQGPSLEPPPF
jgi:hypothetical protein